MTYISGSPVLETSLRVHMLQLSHYVRETHVFVVGFPCCHANTKSPAEIKVQHLHYGNNFVIILTLQQY